MPIIRTYTRLGWMVAATCVIAWLLAWRLGWKELAVIAGAALALLLGSLLFTLGKAQLVVSLELQPKRVTVGERATGQMLVTNSSGRRQLPARLELRVGSGRAEFHVPSLAHDDKHDELFGVPTTKRSVIPVGPVVSVKGDPVGVCRVEQVWTGVDDLFVHPRISPLDRLGSGFIKDLEGQATNDLSVSDVAFHTLREYVPGDDRRHVHWKTSAKIGTLMVRQFVDTRRSHLAVILSTEPADYLNEDEFELAVSLAGSLAARTLRDEQEVSLICGGHPMAATNPIQMLDSLAKVEYGSPDGGLQAGAMQANRTAANASIVAVAVGSNVGLPEVRQAAARMASDARLVVLRADLQGELAYRPVGTIAVINVPALDQFAQGLWRASQV